MRTPLLIASSVLALGVGFAAPAAAANPPGTGLPGQSCQDLEPNVPGHANASPGSPFNEAGIDSAAGGIGGQHYTETSQYDVACFQLSQR
ncbi:MAG TPA: hypothetical protein VIM17_13655 [Jatrophihabitantaceae bacterium]|jgi:hypothetical protein